MKLVIRSNRLMWEHLYEERILCFMKAYPQRLDRVSQADLSRSLTRPHTNVAASTYDSALSSSWRFTTQGTWRPELALCCPQQLAGLCVLPAAQ